MCKRFKLVVKMLFDTPSRRRVRIDGDDDVEEKMNVARSKEEIDGNDWIEITSNTGAVDSLNIDQKDSTNI